MAKLFGTDGIRGKANTYPLTPEMIVRIGQSIAGTFGDRPDAHIIVGADTRVSGDMIASAISSGICSCGINVLHAGIIPTPAVAWLTAQTPSAVAGIVISASHNPYFDNGIKVFDSHGFKLTDQIEADIENRILDGGADQNRSQANREIGHVIQLSDAEKRYLGFLRRCWAGKPAVSGLKLVIDCANGATCRVAPALFSSLKIDVTALFTDPDGRNINSDCGSEHTGILARKVIEAGADVGLAFDGDGDRLAVVDETGRRLTGDQVLAICADDLKTEGRLVNNRVVNTVMSNIGLAAALTRLGIDHETADVGDRRVMEKMKATGAILGGEDSGHIIFLDQHSTGDGLLSALRLMAAMIRQKKPLSELAGIMTVAPQILVNVSVSSKPDLNTLAPLQQAISQVESELGSQGRVLVRYSGTQPMCRVMVEGPDSEITEKYCHQIADVVSRTIGTTA
ncbi:MAG: phosphoglucosamine mutase [Deltaproteobacteria bacterium]|nr:MAG: phosphoglucosamine mutase [Deltaproteobacteria bacterium]